MLTHTDYFKGRDGIYAEYLTEQIQINARLTLARINALLLRFYQANPKVAPRTINSGWRPPSVNRGVKNAAKNSHHLRATACDLDDDDGELDKWLMTKPGQQALIDIGLWMEHPNATPRWCHVQTIAPRSGNRVFVP